MATYFSPCQNQTKVIMAFPISHDYNFLLSLQQFVFRYSRNEMVDWFMQVQEKIRGQRGRLQVQALGYVNSTKVIFGDISRTEVCFPRRPH